ncbi:MAG: carbonic anhydrase [Polyangiaceae bacterium]|nr:carbonic anhydrase [Polyangiaceae bacterium]
MRRIIEGFLHFRRHVRPSLAALFETLAEGQSPGVLLVACSDSRVVPNRIISSDPGEVFEVRTVGNLIAPAAAGGLSVADHSEACAIEYAVGVLGVRDVVVMGHSRCGAMKAFLHGADASEAPNLAKWLAHAAPSKDKLAALAPSTGLDEVDRLSQANVLAQLDHIATYPVVQAARDRRGLDLHGTWLDVRTGDLHLHDPEQQAFVMLDETEGARRLTAFSVARVSET